MSGTAAQDDEVIARFLAGDRRACARLISLAEAGAERFGRLYDRIHDRVGRAHRIGITGPPGSGKSTLVDGLIEVLRDDVPEVVVLLARPIPTVWSEPDDILDELSEELDDLVAAHDTSESPVVLVDQREGFNAETDLYDGLHPNAVGEQKMAAKWLEALLPYL